MMCSSELKTDRIAFYNALGSEVFSGKVVFDASRVARFYVDLPDGIYLAVGYDREGIAFRKKLIVSN